MPTPSIGYLSRLGVASEGTYGTPVVVTQLQAMLSETFTHDYAQLRDVVLQGRAGGRQADQGVQNVKGDVKLRWRYVTNDLILKQWFGALAAGQYTAQPHVVGTGLTMAFGKPTETNANEVWELAGCKVTKLVFAGTPANQMELTASVIAQRLSLTSGINTPTVLAALDDSAPNILFTDLHCLLGDLTGVLTSANEDIFGFDTLTITLDRPMDEVHTNKSRQIIEPYENNMRNANTMAFKVPRHWTSQYQSWRDSQTRLQAALTWTGPGTSSKKFIFPQLVHASVKSAIPGPGVVPIDGMLDLNEAEDQLISVALFATASDNSLNIDATTAAAATGTLTMTGVAKNGETVTVGHDVYEVDTNPIAPTVAAGHIPIGLSGGSTRRAQGTLTIGAQPSNNDTMTIGTKVYTFQTNGALTNIDGHIEIGSSLANTKTNIINAINRSGTPGTGYAQATVKHPSVTIATSFTVNNAVISANEGGTAGNSIATTSTFTSGSNLFDAATLGTTQAGVDPTAAEFCTAFIHAVEAAGTSQVFASQGAGTTVTLTAEQAGAQGNSIVTTETLSNGSFGAGTLTGGTGSLDTIPFAVVGADVWVHGFATGANSGKAKVVSWTAHKLVLDSGMTLVDEAAGPSVLLQLRSFDCALTEA